jgi:hypothetical protein
VRIVVCLEMALIGGATGHAAESQRDRKQIEEATRLQIFLDNSNFGPGKFHRARCKSRMYPPCQLGRRETGRDGETRCPGCCGVKIR